MRREKFKWQRALWGFSAFDTWDMDVYLADLIGDMLLYKAKFGNFWVEDMSEEEAQQWLIDTAEMFKTYNLDLPTPSYEKYKESVTHIKNEDGSITTESDDALAKAWMEEEQANYEFKMTRLREGLSRLGEYFSSLWD